MVLLEYIKELQEKNLLLLGISEEGESARYTINRNLYIEIGSPKRGEEISADSMEQIKFFDEHYRSKKKALSILAYADNNKRELKMKLLRAGFASHIIDECIADMVELGYINEERQLFRLVMKEADKMRGPRRIVAALSAKGYSTSDIHKAIRALCDSGEIDFDKIKKHLIDTKLGENADHEEKKKLLYKSGF